MPFVVPLLVKTTKHVIEVTVYSGHDGVLVAQCGHRRCCPHAYLESSPLVRLELRSAPVRYAELGHRLAHPRQVLEGHPALAESVEDDHVFEPATLVVEPGYVVATRGLILPLLSADYEYESVSDECGGVVEAGEGTGVGERPTVEGKNPASQEPVPFTHRRSISPRLRSCARSTSPCTTSRALRRGERTHGGAQATEWAQTWRKNTSCLKARDRYTY
mmetsp:Transcript_41559/g.117998  ORF Transcript_41559/g.117998 Transcript_41559/m.117998 type:complete len:218 (-) Transcript_41559:935-1588(-)